MPTIRVQPEPFDVAAEIAALSNTSIGGVGCFIGVVRNTAGGRPIQAMTLEHYPGMTERSLAAIAAEAASRFPLLATTIIHRIGRLLPGEPIVLVLTASAHRQAALDATAFLIDWLKTSAPFWKNEEFDTGAAWVAENAADQAALGRWSTPAQP